MTIQEVRVAARQLPDAWIQFLIVNALEVRGLRRQGSNHAELTSIDLRGILREMLDNDYGGLGSKAAQAVTAQKQIEAVEIVLGWWHHDG